MSQPTSPESLHNLEDILAAEITTCSELLELGEAVREALMERCPETLRTQMISRDRLLAHLDRLEKRATVLRQGGHVLPDSLEGEKHRLRSLIERTMADETSLQQLSSESLRTMQQKLQGLQTGTRMLHGYRGNTETPPRFADRRG